MSWWEEAYRSGYVNWEPGEFDGHLPWLLESYGIGPCRAVDLGCGTGRSAVWLARAGFEVTGIDLSPTAIKTARRTARESGLSCTFLAGSFPEDFDDSALPPGNFGLAIERGFLQHFREGAGLDLILERTARLLRPGGLFYSLIAAREGARGYPWLHRWSEAGLRRAFEKRFRILEIRESVFTHGESGSLPSWVTVMSPLEGLQTAAGERFFS